MPSRLTRTLAPLTAPLVPLSFGAPGFRLRRRGFHDPDLDVDLRGRSILVTGANAGLGFALSQGLARRGAQLTLVCRSRERGEAALARLQEDAPEARLRLELADLSDLEAVAALGERLPERLDVLVHNAGVLPTTHGLSPQGLERTLATNLVGPFLLSCLALPRMTGPEARILHVSSGGMYTQRLEVDRLDAPARGFDGVVAYARTKRAQVVLTELMAARLERVAVHCMHPGWADTPGVQGSLPRFRALTRSILRTPEQGADTALWLAAAPTLPGPSGSFWFDRQVAPTHLLPGTKSSAAERERLWTQLWAWIGRDPGSFPRN